MAQKFAALQASEWVMVNDDVMGGISTSRLQEKRGGLRLDGYLSTENNGGFNSARSKVIAPLDAIVQSKGISVQWRGSARPFQVIVHLRNRRIREYYRAFLLGNPALISWEQFEFRRRGRLDPTRNLSAELDQIIEMGILLSDGFDGAWWLELEEISLWNPEQSSSEANTAAVSN